MINDTCAVDIRTMRQIRALCNYLFKSRVIFINTNHKASHLKLANNDLTN